MPVGIENLATGFLQGLNARKQQERQDVIDQREAERFDMQKQQFADNQAANQLAMKTNQFQLGQAQKTADRDDITWNQQQDEINRKKAFESDLRTIYSLEKEGNTEGLAKFLTEKNKTLGIKGDFERDYVTGKGALKLDKDGKAVFVHEDGSRTTYDMDDYGADFVAKFDPVTAIRNKQKTAEEIAKEDRLFKREVELVGLNAKNAERLARLRESLTPPRKEVFDGEDGTYVINVETGIPTPVVNTSTGKPLVRKIKGQLSEKDYEPYLPLAQQFFGNIKPNELKDIVKKQTKSQFIENALRTFNTKNVGKYVNSKDRLQAEQTINALADSLYGQQTVSANNPQQVISRLGANSTNGLNAVQPQNSPVDLLRGKNIVTEQDAADAIRELRAKKFTDEQINAAFDELGL